MERHILMKLRTATKEDFSTPAGLKKTGILYFEQSHTGAIQTTPKYFTESTEMKEFLPLYAKGQIFVPVQLFDPVAVLEEEEILNQ